MAGVQNLRRVLKAASFFGLAAGGVLACALAGLHFHWHVAPFRGAAFSPERWQAVWHCDGLSAADCALHHASCPRGPMVRDLLASHIDLGQTTRAQARAMLGDPEWRAPVAVGSHLHRHCDMHMLGMCSGFGIDYDALFVCFDGNDQVSAVGHRQT